MADAPRQGLGAFFRALMDYVDERGLRDQVRGLVSEQTKAVIDDPPRALSFIPSTPIDEIEVALQKLAGDEALVECGIACARPLGWSLLQPVIRMAFMMFGQSPEPIFSNLDRFFSMVTRGITFTWAPGEKGGSVSARFAGEGTPEAAFHVLRGTLLFVYELSGTVGEVGPPEVLESTPECVTILYDVGWK
ncbi:MAG: hypothetical protein ACXWLR_00800 [Myxococcales bacterium]